MTPLSSASGHWVLASQAHSIVQIAGRWNVTPDRLLSGVHLTEATLNDPIGRISVGSYQALLERARTLTGEPGLGFFLAKQKRVTTYGYLGFAAMTASSLGEALEIAARYAPVVSSLVRISLHVEGRVACLAVDEQVDLGSVRDIPLIALVFGMQRMAGTLTGRELRAHYVDLSVPEPPYFPRFAHLLPHTRFGQSVSQIVFDAALLDLPLVHADRVALRLAREQCECALDTLELRGDSDVQRIRQMVGADDGCHSLEQVARTLGVSTRTLKRRLAVEGVSFSMLLAQERRKRARFLLDMRHMPLEEVALRMGYSSLSNFARAFRQWTGTSPAEYRRSRRRVPDSIGVSGVAPR